MNLNHELIEELTLLKRFSMGGRTAMDLQENPDPAIIAAAQRMFAKGLITEADGGNLTDSGRQAVDHMNALLNLLSPPLEPI